MKTIEDWWNMIFTNKITLIIMLADAEEERINPVCAFYWSEETFRIEGDITIQTLKVEQISSKIKTIKMSAK